MDRNIELEEFYAECNKILHEESFDKKLKRDFYRVYKGIKDGTIFGVCKNCIMYDAKKRKCTCNFSIEEKAVYCWKANNITILKKEKMYGQKRNIKTGIN